MPISRIWTILKTLKFVSNILRD